MFSYVPQKEAEREVQSGCARSLLSVSFFFFIRSRNQADVVSRRLKPAEDFTSCLSLKSRGTFASLSNIVNVGMVN